MPYKINIRSSDSPVPKSLRIHRSFRSSINHDIAISTSLETFEILNLIFISLMSVDFKFSNFKSSKPQYKKNSWQMDKLTSVHQNMKTTF